TRRGRGRARADAGPASRKSRAAAYSRPRARRATAGTTVSNWPRGGREAARAHALVLGPVGWRPNGRTHGRVLQLARLARPARVAARPLLVPRGRSRSHPHPTT